MKTTNAKSRKFVQNLEEFKANNLSGRKEGHYYVVYSYNWYPLFVFSFKDSVWFQNSERYSVSTSKQTSQCHPHTECIQVTHEQIKDLLKGRTVVA